MSFEIKDIDAKVMGAQSWRAVAFVYPFADCQTILSVGIDPIAIKTEIVNDLMERLRKK